MYRNLTNFCVLICILNIYWIFLFVLPVFDGVFRIFYIYIISSANCDHFTTSFPIWIPFISFSCLVIVARTSNTMLNKSGKGGHPYLVPDLKRKVETFLPLRMMLAVELSYTAFIMLRYVPIPTLLRVLWYTDVEFYQMLSLHPLRWSYDFYSSFC